MRAVFAIGHWRSLETSRPLDEGKCISRRAGAAHLYVVEPLRLPIHGRIKENTIAKRTDVSQSMDHAP